MHQEYYYSDYRQIVSAEEGHKYDVKVTINGEDYYLYGNLRSLVTRAHTFGTNVLHLGTADSREIELEIFGNSSRIPRNAEMQVYIRAMDMEERQYSNSWIPKGTFYIDTRKADSETIDDDEVISITGMDAMMRGECVFKDFPEPWMEAGETSAFAVLQYCAELIGVEIDSRTYQIMTRDFEVPLPMQYTIREALKNVAGLYGGGFIINDYGRLQLICPWYSTQNYDLGKNAQGLTVFPPYPYVKGVRMLISEKGYAVTKKNEYGDEESIDCYFAGSEYGSGYIYEIDCPWASQDQAEWLYSCMSSNGFIYAPYQCSDGELDPCVEIGDTITINDKVTGGLYSQEITFGKYITSEFGAPGEEEIDHEYQYETSTDRKYARRMYNAEATLAIHATDIEARVTKIGSNAEGEDEESTFGWILESDHWEVYSGDPPKSVLYVDENGLHVYGDGEFTGSLVGNEIYIPKQFNEDGSDGWNFMVSRDGHMTATNADISGIIRADGGIYVGDESVATSEQLYQIMNELREAMQLEGGAYQTSGGSGLINSLNAANRLNRAAFDNSTDPIEVLTVENLGVQETLSVGDHIYSPDIRAIHFKVLQDSSSGDSTNTYDIEDHTHEFEEQNDGEIHIKKADWTGADHYFNIADTKFYKDRVSAIDVTSLTPTFPPYSLKYLYGEVNGKKILSFRIKYKLGSSLDSTYNNSQTEKTYGTTLTIDADEAYNAGWNAAKEKYQPTSVSVSSTISSNGEYYNITATAKNSAGETLKSGTGTTSTTAWSNGRKYGEDLHANDYKEGQKAGRAEFSGGWYDLLGPGGWYYDEWGNSYYRYEWGGQEYLYTR